MDFVKSFEIGPYIYFFFRERSLECSSCGKVKTSRVARVCKVKELTVKVECIKDNIEARDYENWFTNFASTLFSSLG